MGLPACALLAVLCLGAPAAAAAPDPSDATDDRARERDRMVREVARMVRRTADQTGVAELSPRILDALRAVPRHRFVRPEEAPAAYVNHALPIGQGQTISQPFIVALMTQLAAPTPDDRVLEIGTGSGYQAAVLAELVDRVDTIEIVPELAETARRRLQALGYDDVRVHVGDGFHGVPEHAPYDAILVTAAARAVPPALAEQLRVGGRIVMPIGPQDRAQLLKTFTKDPDGTLAEQFVLSVRFVPFTRSDGGPSEDRAP